MQIRMIKHQLAVDRLRHPRGRIASARGGTGLVPQKLLLWWPVAAISLLSILGWAVRTGPTAIDIWFQHSGRPWWRLLYLSDEKVLLGALVAALGIGYRRRWVVVVLMFAVPVLRLRSSGR